LNGVQRNDDGENLDNRAYTHTIVRGRRAK
jgi:hypothetical protein